ncbi:hypothetical protein CANCADRAFT_86700 [Tortispora caseinolytica NRRL Y-17796]|uniref:PCI domain-containing protein n=1 Tax=Tortispora caseinolytica NRRL Y-17796 TaxID=767744 RepID=A0A1E4TLA3_9ASCO|nr:hypothetical protein CANCADRAFT_86700 [Tortispora caseinolytica NRRL Y-17796]
MNLGRAQAFMEAVRTQNGSELSRLTSIDRPPGSGGETEKSMLQYVISDPQWRDYFIYNNDYYNYLMKSDLQNAFKSDIEALNILARIAARENKWILPVLKGNAGELCAVAIITGRFTNSNEPLESSARIINRLLNLCLGDREPTMSLSKKYGVYRIMNLLFILYFRLNNRSIARSTLQAVTASSVVLPPFEEFSVSDRCMFLYFKALILISESHYSQAHDALQQSLRLCHRASRNNIRRILVCLVPLRFMLYQIIPSASLYTAFPELEKAYKQLFEAVRAGNITEFDKQIDINKALFFKKNLYLLMRKSKIIVQKRLLICTYQAMDCPTRLPLPAYRAAFAVFGKKITSDELECYLTNLIASGNVKGYISREHAMLILRKTDPFPVPEPSTVESK